MKNIHVIQTDKPSRLFIGRYRKELFLCYKPTSNIFIAGQNQHIYITSDEEIKDKCYVLSQISIGALYLDGVINTASMLAERQWKKIILTTDQDLINNGVQAIDDEFLEWFVKNPNCEEVEVKLKTKQLVKPYDVYNEFVSYYKIIIPKEEPKQETLEESKDLSYYKTNAEEDYLSVPISVLRYISQLEQQAERMYSEEEVKKIMALTWIICLDSNGEDFTDNRNEILKQFKKK